ncbi:aminodeoxychorismate lyase [Cytobacillus purgationiresistens]|uniref:4-amino-4-deoxychorismate lyase n=1 Tax=Cytobacillus purgationiresistens TaxID=863449 RepID=A0ABU0AP62_9BACI|nr:aminodeoxychorismate lyase [Cytobacillus purgationiresistens]MDQ0273074.1 4-amino-4-deoxychorismate lyase [Cytobacillus purgationiresistens]
MYISLNGKIVHKDEAMISPFDHGFLYGLGLFETFRVYEGHPFLLDDHLARLNRGMEALNIYGCFTRVEVKALLERLLDNNQYQNARIRMNVSAGIGEVGLKTTPYLSPNVMIFSSELQREVTKNEKKAVVLELPRNTPEGKERLKSHHFLNNILAKREIGNHPDIEGVFLTADGYLAEGVSSNLFWLAGGTLFTPAISTGILDGITRQFIIHVAGEIGWRVEEGHYTLQQALNAEEVFVTNSVQEICALTDFAGKRFPGYQGEYVNELHRLYQQYRRTLWSRTEVQEESL